MFRHTGTESELLDGNCREQFQEWLDIVYRDEVLMTEVSDGSPAVPTSSNTSPGRMAEMLEAARLALGHAGLRADRLVVLVAVQERATFRAGHAVVKVDSDTRRLKHELAMMTAARGVGVPVPGVIAFERGSPAVLVMQHVPGEALRPAHGPEPVRDVGRLLRRLHSLPAPREAAWDLHLWAWTDLRTRQLVERHLLHADDAARIRSRVEDVRAILADRPCCLIHDDLQPDHVLVDRGRISAFLDFADADRGDPLNDVAVLTLWEPTFEQLLWQGYEPDSETVSSGRVLLPVYRMLRHIGAAFWLAEQGLDSQQHTDRMHQLLGPSA